MDVVNEGQRWRDVCNLVMCDGQVGEARHEEQKVRNARDPVVRQVQLY